MMRTLIHKVSVGAFLATVILLLTAQASGGIVEFWTPGPDLTVKQFQEVDQRFYVIPHLKCSSFPDLRFRYGLADTLFVDPTISDTSRRCIVFVNENPVTDEMFPNF